MLNQISSSCLPGQHSLAQEGPALGTLQWDPNCLLKQEQQQGLISSSLPLSWD